MLGAMRNHRSIRTVSAPVALLAFTILVGAAREAQPRDSDSALPGTTDTRAWWQSRLDLLREGMTLEEVRTLLPSWGAMEAWAGTGSGKALTWRVSPHWLVQVGFSHSDRCFGGGRLIAVAEEEGGRPERIARILRRRAYVVPSLMSEAKESAVERRTAWHVEEEIEVYADGRYRWTQVSHAEADDAVREGTLPEQMTADLADALGVGSTPLWIDVTEAGPREPPPPAVTAVLTHLESKQRGQPPEKR
jgi:hypothetical protein